MPTRPDRQKLDRKLKHAGVVVKPLGDVDAVIPLGDVDAVIPLGDVDAVIPLFATWPTEDASEVLCLFTQFLVANARLGVGGRAVR